MHKSLVLNDTKITEHYSKGMTHYLFFVKDKTWILNCEGYWQETEEYSKSNHKYENKKVKNWSDTDIVCIYCEIIHFKSVGRTLTEIREKERLHACIIHLTPSKLWNKLTQNCNWIQHPRALSYPQTTYPNWQISLPFCKLGVRCVISTAGVCRSLFHLKLYLKKLNE